MHNAIQKARKEELITEEEERRFLGFKEFIRNAFVHSDKTKIFDPGAMTKVDLVKLEDGKLEHKESRMMAMLGLNLAQGIAEKDLANRNCRQVFEDIDSMLLQICKRFWATHQHK
jgi:hypothetical protein